MMPARETIEKIIREKVKQAWLEKKSYCFMYSTIDGHVSVRHVGPHEDYVDGRCILRITNEMLSKHHTFDGEKYKDKQEFWDQKLSKEFPFGNLTTFVMDELMTLAFKYEIKS